MMKKSIFNVKLILTLITALLLFSCDGEDGMDGVDGIDGIDGVNGSNGIDGEDGNANVTASDWITIQFATGATLASTFEIVDPDVTEEMANSAVILAYGKRLVNGGATERVYQLPAQFPQGNYSFFTEDFNDDGEYEMNFQAISPDGNLYVYDRFVEVRYVIIPASTTGKSSNRNFSKMSYEEVMDYFNLEY